MEDELSRAEEALRYIPADDRDTWVRMAFALKRHFGDAAMPIWLSWSMTSAKYSEKPAMTCWRSVKDNGVVDIRHLYRTARANGWLPRNTATVSPDDLQKHYQERRDAERQLNERRAQNAARTARRRYQQAQQATHPYLERKGFPGTLTRVLNNRIILPMAMRPQDDNFRESITAVQSIQADGEKRFEPPYCVSSGATMHLRRRAHPDIAWHCEGYATALSVAAALDVMGRDNDLVVIAFSAGNLLKTAKKGIVIADHDLYICRYPECAHRWDEELWNPRPICPRCQREGIPPTGERFARSIGLTWWQSPEPGDANDHHLNRGLDDLADQLANGPLAEFRLNEQGNSRH